MHFSLELTPGLCIAGAFLLLVVPLPWLIGAVLAVCFHEICHLVALGLLGGASDQIRFGALGAEIPVSRLSVSQEFLAAAAGPAGSLLLFLFIHPFPRLAVCGLIQGLYNLLPIYPMDGGRMVKCLLILSFGEKAGETAGRKIGRITLALLWGFSLYLAFFVGYGPAPVCICAGIWLKTKKYLAKSPVRHYNSTDYES